MYWQYQKYFPFPNTFSELLQKKFPNFTSFSTSVDLTFFQCSSCHHPVNIISFTDLFPLKLHVTFSLGFGEREEKIKNKQTLKQ